MIIVTTTFRHSLQRYKRITIAQVVYQRIRRIYMLSRDALEIVSFLTRRMASRMDVLPHSLLSWIDQEKGSSESDNNLTSTDDSRDSADKEPPLISQLKITDTGKKVDITNSTINIETINNERLLKKVVVIIEFLWIYKKWNSLHSLSAKDIVK